MTRKPLHEPETCAQVGKQREEEEEEVDEFDLLLRYQFCKPEAFASLCNLYDTPPPRGQSPAPTTTRTAPPPLLWRIRLSTHHCCSC